MSIDKSLLTGSTTMLILKLLEEKDMYGYEMIEELRIKSQNIFELKAGTLYPLLHTLEQKDLLTSYEQNADNQRVRKYYSITPKGRKFLKEKTQEWRVYTSAVNKVLGGADLATIQ
jgi:PadR family transcriptional regulator PadR